MIDARADFAGALNEQRRKEWDLMAPRERRKVRAA